MEFTFTLKYQLADDDYDSHALIERLGEAGCNDAVVGIGQPGRLVLEFTREAENVEAAMRSALADVRHAEPSAKLLAEGQAPLLELQRFGCRPQTSDDRIGNRR